MISMPPLVRPPEMPEEIRQLLDAIGGKVNVEILRLLAAGPMTTTELSERIGNQRGSINRVLRVLERQGLVVASHPPETDRKRVRQVWTTDIDAVRKAADQWLAYVTGK